MTYKKNYLNSMNYIFKVNRTKKETREEKVKKVLGLDIGIASVGWSFVEIDEEKLSQIDPETGEVTLRGKIIGLGVRTFTQAENPKDGKSLALPRREKRSQRRRLRRRRQRLDQLKELFIGHHLLSAQEIDELLKPQAFLRSPWQLRAEAIDRLLTKEELFRALYHLAKSRGYKPQKGAISDEKAKKEDGVVKEAIRHNNQLLEQSGLLTFPQLLVSNNQQPDPVFRNRDGSYINSIPRPMIQQEAQFILEKQISLGASYVTQEFIKKFKETAFTQRSAMDRKQMEKMIGHCIFEKIERKAARNSYSAELFILLTKIANLNLRTIDNPEKIELTHEQKNKIRELAYQQKTVSYKTIRSSLALEDQLIFKGLSYSSQKTKGGKEKDPESEKFIELKGYYDIKKAYEGFGTEAFHSLLKNPEQFDQICEILTTTKTEEESFAELKQIVSDEIAEKLKNISFSKYIHLSLKALYRINPYLEQWHGYAKACELAEYSLSSESQKFEFLPSFEELKKQEIIFDEIRNPVVHRAVCQVRKVVNAIIRQYGRPDQINIEFTRNAKNSFKKRQEIRKGQEEYKEEKEQAKKQCEAMGLNSDEGDNLLRLRLWRQQDEKCVYSAKDIRIADLQNPRALEIDHIIPYSRSLDDSLNNKVLCLVQENRQKRNQIPAEYFGIDTPKWEDFKQRVTASALPSPKKSRLLKLKIEDEEKFIERNLRDTSYITRYTADYIRHFLRLNNHKNIKNAVQTRNGSLTAFLRHHWGFNKNREAGDQHHALDALVCAVSTQGMVQYLSRYTSRLEEKGKEWLKKFAYQSYVPVPWGNWESFRDEVKEHLEKIFVSRAPRRKASGEIHQDTIRSVKKLETDGVSAIRTKLASISAKNAEALGEIIFDTDRGPNSVYQVILESLEQHGWNSKKAFVTDLHMRRRDGTDGPVIKTVRLKDTQKSGMTVRQGIANNGDMVRVDVFSKDKKFYLVPIYLKDFTQCILPNKAATAGKEENDWRVMDDTYQFMFSLFKDDLILVKKKKESEVFGYFKSMHRGTAAINLDYHDTSAKEEGIGVQSLEIFKKYQVDVLGNYTEVKGEKRRPLGKPKVA